MILLYFLEFVLYLLQQVLIRRFLIAEWDQKLFSKLSAVMLHAINLYYGKAYVIYLIHQIYFKLAQVL